MKRLIPIFTLMMISVSLSVFASQNLKSVPDKFQGTYYFKAVSEDLGETWELFFTDEPLIIQSNQKIHGHKPDKITEISEDGSSLVLKCASGMCISISRFSQKNEIYILTMLHKGEEMSRFKVIKVNK